MDNDSNLNPTVIGAVGALVALMLIATGGIIGALLDSLFIGIALGIAAAVVFGTVLAVVVIFTFSSTANTAE